MLENTEKPNKESLNFDTTEKLEFLTLRIGLRMAILKKLNEEKSISPELREIIRVLISTYSRNKEE